MRSIRLAALVAGALLSTTAFAATPRKDAQPAVKPVRLTRDDLSKATDLMNRIADAVEKDPSIADSIPRGPLEHSTVDDVTTRVEHSRLAPIFHEVGMTPRQYIETVVSISWARVYAMRQQQGKAPPDPISADNARLLASNPDAMKAFEQAVERVKALESTQQR